MALLEVNENQQEMLLEYLKNILSDLQSHGPYGSRSLEGYRIEDMENIKDLIKQLKGTK